MKKERDAPLDEATIARAEADWASLQSLACANTQIRQMIVPAAEPDDEFIPTDLQHSILNALNQRALKKDSLAAAVKCEPSRLYKPGGIKELMETGKVANKRGLGYYRPDAPPVGPKRD